ncbi:MAG TPA: DNA primase [Luteolibacter sp.]
MPQIPQESIEQVLAATSIEDLIGSYIPVKRAGSGFKALCPFHHEKTPSFSINPARQTFHCFGCGKGGDAIAFVREYENLPFTDAVRKLAARAGIPIIEVESDPHADQARRLRGRLLDLHREVSAFLHTLLLKAPEAAHARGYLNSRGFGKDMAVRWQIGWIPESPRTFLDWARQKGYTGRDLVNAGLAALRDENNPRSGLYLRFRDRLMFPIRNEIGDVIAFSGRQLKEGLPGGKYVNSPETPIFRKGNVLFGLDRAKKPILTEKSVLLCEGQIDAISCHEHGIAHAIAPLGTAFTPQHARLLRRYAKTVVLCYDGDNAGFSGAEKAFVQLIAEGLNVKAVELPKGDDPDTFLKVQGPEAFRELLANARDFFDFKLDRASTAGTLATASGRAALGNECAALLAAMTDHVAREAQINHLATRLQLSPPGLREAVAHAGRQAQRRTPEATGEETAATVAPTPLDRTIGYLCQLALASTAVQHLLAEQFEALHEADQYLEGIPLLDRILDGAPDPEAPASVNAFLGTLPEPDRLALQQRTDFSGELLGDPLDDAMNALAQLAAKCLLQRDARNKAAQREPGLAPARMVALLEEAKEIQKLLAGIDVRFLNEDQYTRYKTEAPPKRDGFRFPRKP